MLFNISADSLDVWGAVMHHAALTGAMLSLLVLRQRHIQFLGTVKRSSCSIKHLLKMISSLYYPKNPFFRENAVVAIASSALLAITALLDRAGVKHAGVCKGPLRICCPPRGRTR